MIRNRARIILSAALLAALVSSGMAGDESYTNSTGKVLVGTVTGFTNSLVSIRADHGMIRTVALNAFPAAEQERLLLAAGKPIPLPATLAQRLEFLRDSVIRAERLKMAGLLSAEVTVARQQALRIAWRRGLDDALAQNRISSALHGQWINALP